jgi:tetratricopeptide (TPR) repeat protein
MPLSRQHLKWLAVLALLVAGGMASFFALRTPIADEQAFSKRAFLSMNQGNWQEMLNIAAEWRTAHPHSALPFAVSGDAWRLQGNSDQALKAYESYLAIDQKNPEVWAYYGATLFGVGRRDDSIKACETATAILPTSPIGWYCLASGYAFQGNRAATERASQKLSEANPQLFNDFKQRVLPQHICPNLKEQLGPELCPPPANG